MREADDRREATPLQTPGSTLELSGPVRTQHRFWFEEDLTNRYYNNNITPCRFKVESCLSASSCLCKASSGSFNGNHSRPLMEDPGQRLEEQQWARRIQGGDHDAFEALFRRYYKPLCDFAESHRVGTSASEAAEDLVQEVFLDLWRRHQSWTLRATPRAYLFGAVRNKAIKRIKRQQVRRRWSEEQQARTESVQAFPGPGVDLRRREIERAMRQSVDRLPPRRRQVYVLSRDYGLTYNEIAAVMDISSRTVEHQMAHALKFLRGQLKHFLSTAV